MTSSTVAVAPVNGSPSALGRGAAATDTHTGVGGARPAAGPEPVSAVGRTPQPAGGADGGRPGATASGGPGGATPAPPAPPATPGLPSGAADGSKSPVVIGSVLPRSGPIGGAAAPGLEALQTWTRLANDRGGVNGHRVDLVVGDDGGDPARHRSIVQEFVERRHVIAFVQNFESLGGEGSIDYLTAKRIPVIGSIMGSQYFYEHPTYFPQGSSGDAFFEAYAGSVAQQAKATGKQRIGVLACAEVADCKTGADLTERYAKELGLSVVYKATASIVQPDYTAQCLNARNAGVEILLPIFTPDGASRISASCARQGYTPVFGLTTQTFSPTQLTDPTMQGAIIYSPVFTWAADPPSSAVAEFNAAMAKYLPGVAIKGVHAVGWTSAKVFERGAAQLAEPPTSESLLDGLWSISHDDLGGLTQPLTFTRDRPAAPMACWFTALIRDHKLAAANGGQRSCR